jgi:hypothetical protein
MRPVGKVLLFCGVAGYLVCSAAAPCSAQSGAPSAPADLDSANQQLLQEEAALAQRFEKAQGQQPAPADEGSTDKAFSALKFGLKNPQQVAGPSAERAADAAAPAGAAAQPVEQAGARAAAPAWQQELAAREQNIQRLSSDNQRLRNAVMAKETEAQKLRDALKDAKKSLMTAELEVERLSAILRDRNTAVIARSLGTDAEQPKAAAPARAAMPVRPQPQTDDEMPVATVIVKSAHLRSGPGPNNSPLMSVERGARLTVEQRVDDWYRVIAPTGKRAWIAASMVRFGKDALSSPSPTVRIEGYRSDIDNAPQKMAGDSF